MKRKLFFTVSQQSGISHGYSHARISLHLHDEYRNGRDPFVEFVWQSDSEQSEAKWYAPHVEARSDSDTGFSPVEQFKQIAALLGKLGLPDSPMDVASELVRTGIERRIWDNRLSKYLAPSEVLPAAYRRFMAMVGGTCAAQCVASSEEQAQRELLKEMGKRIAEPCFSSSDYAAKELQEWIAAGKPVTLDSRAIAPAVKPLDEVWIPLGRAPIQQAA